MFELMDMLLAGMDQPQADQPNSLADVLGFSQVLVTGTAEFYVTRKLYADDLTLMAKNPVALPTMVYRLHAYAQMKHLVINTAKSE
eukprot:357645-Pelagomonas_calceolata.AAC.2